MEFTFALAITYEYKISHAGDLINGSSIPASCNPPVPSGKLEGGREVEAVELYDTHTHTAAVAVNMVYRQSVISLLNSSLCWFCLLLVEILSKADWPTMVKSYQCAA